jgi:hypothetical protein
MNTCKVWLLEIKDCYFLFRDIKSGNRECSYYIKMYFIVLSDLSNMQAELQEEDDCVFDKALSSSFQYAGVALC